jgi:apolipoprotein N-acyltransferase
MRSWAFSIISGFLLAFSFAPPSFSFFAFVAFIPLFFVLERQSLKKACFFSYLAGLVFFLVSISWLAQVTIVGWLLLCVYLALYFALFGVLACFYIRGGINLRLLLVLPCLWSSLEFLRSHFLTGFGWNCIGYSQFQQLPLIQIADFSSVYGVSFFVILVNCILWLVIRMARDSHEHPRKRALILSVFILVTISLATLSYGWFRLQQAQDSQDGLRVSVIQPNIPQTLKWSGYAQDYIIEYLVNLTQKTSQDQPDLIIWPESAMPIYLEEDFFRFDTLFSLAKQMKVYLLTGVVRQTEEEFFNSAILISPAGKLEAHYDKFHLVPYGEFIPLRKFMPFIGTVVGIGDFTPGKNYTVFHAHQNKQSSKPSFAVLICFEDAFPYLSRQFVRRGADFLVNITNDAWFGDSGQTQQHVSQSVFRAIENRVDVVRCANTGISGLIDARGKIVKLVKGKKGKTTYVSGFTSFVVYRQKMAGTLYTRHGDYFAWLCVAWALVELLARLLGSKIKTLHAKRKQ